MPAFVSTARRLSGSTKLKSQSSVPLIGIGYTRGSDFQQGLGQRVKQAIVAETPLESEKIIQKGSLRLGIEDPGYIVLYCLLVDRIWVDPARMHLGYASSTG